MKFLTCSLVLIVLLSTACSFSIVGKVLDKINPKGKVLDVKGKIEQDKIKVVIKDGTDKKSELHGHGNSSHGFIPSQIKCKLTDIQIPRPIFIVSAPFCLLAIQLRRSKNAMPVRRTWNVCQQFSAQLI